MTIDLKQEQQASLERPPFPYTPMTRVFVAAMDMVAGRTTSLAKAKMLEVLAGIPYRAWERREESRLPRREAGLREACRGFIRWTQEARHNENLHLEVLDERMRELGLRDPWYLRQPARFGAAAFYAVFANLLARIDMRRAFQFNAEFEDHAEHTYARFAADHPEWDDEAVNGPAVAGYAAETGSELASWGDVVRRIALDERDHMNRSFIACGKPEQVVEYEGMPERPAVACD